MNLDLLPAGYADISPDDPPAFARQLRISTAEGLVMRVPATASVPAAASVPVAPLVTRPAVR